MALIDDHGRICGKVNLIGAATAVAVIGLGATVL
jgi:hypothetical protein